MSRPAKEQFFVLKSSIENIYVKKENQERKELLDLIRQQNCVLQEENASKNTIIKTLVENQTAINHASNEVKNATVQELDKMKSRCRSLNSYRNRVPKTKSNHEIKLVNRYETLYSDYNSSETEDTSSDSASETSPDTCSRSIQKITELNNKSTETRHQKNNITTTNNKKQPVNKENRSYGRENNNNLTRNTSSASNGNSKPKIIVIFLDSILKTLQIKRFNSLQNGGVAHLNSLNTKVASI